jgi:hypothetical protein
MELQLRSGESTRGRCKWTQLATPQTSRAARAVTYKSLFLSFIRVILNLDDPARLLATFHEFESNPSAISALKALLY